MNEQRQKVIAPPRHRAQSGQAIVLIAAIMVGLIGALGLAIDGGGLLFLYRDLQNATDAAIVAATYARCTNGDVLGAGYTAAANSGFNNDGVNNWVEVSNPPSIGPYAGTDDSYVSVTIRATKPSYFIQLVYPGPLEVTNASVGHCRPPFSPANVGALFGISRTCQNTVDWTGSYSVVKGGVFSNNDIHVGASGGGLAVETPIEAVGPIQDPGGWMVGEVSPVAPRSDPLASNFRLVDFAPGGQYTNVGLYTAILSMADDPDFKSNGTWDPANGRTLEGLYYIDGDVSIGNGVNFGPAGITIVATGQISFSGVDYAIEYYTKGFLLYSGYDAGGSCGQNSITVSGSDIGDDIDTCEDILANDYWYGVIYAPKGGVNFSSSDMRMVGAVVADTINRSGADFCLTYDPTVLPPIPPQVEIAQ